MNKKIYFNPAQIDILTVNANMTVVVGGRRLGKTYGIIAPRLLQCVQQMPGASIGIVVQSYKRGLTNTLPGTFKALEDWGYLRGVHWVVGIKPPKYFLQPVIKPMSYENVITFYNGSTAYIISQDIPGSSNSLTLDAVIGDEAKFLNFQKLKDETFPANGGTTAHFGKCFLHHSMLFVSDMPVDKAKAWFLRYEESTDHELIMLIKGIYSEIFKVTTRIKELQAKGESIPGYLPGRLTWLQKEIAKFRRIATYYVEYSSIWNIEVLGEKYIRDMKRDLTPLTFWTSIMSKRIGQAKDGFYPKFTTNHVYDASDNDYLMSLGYNFELIEENANDCRRDADLNREAPIAIGMDYNARINWLVAAQLDVRRLNVLKSFFVKNDRKLPELIEDFCRYYYYHKRKEIIFYYDATALGSNYAVDNNNFAKVIISEFGKYGWHVKPEYLGQPMRHDEKNLLINNMFTGLKDAVPYLNQYNNESLIDAMRITGIYNGKKDKRGEKLGETELDKLELRTDGTDAFDTLCIGIDRKPYRAITNLIIPTGVAI